MGGRAWVAARRRARLRRMRLLPFSVFLAAAAASLLACRETRPEGSPAAPDLVAAQAQGDLAPDILWHLSQLARWVNAPCGAGQSCETESGLGNRTAIRPDDPLYQTHVRLFSRGCGISGEKPPDAPRGRLARWDIDGDGAQELVFAGGCSPEPYFVILTGGRDVFSVWREFSARLLGIEMRNGRLVLAASREGYGVERDRVLVLWNCPPRDPEACVEMIFRWAGEISSDLPDAGVRPCTVVRDAALRTGPAIDDEPEESGMGYDWPGNLYQTMAAGSEGWALGGAAGEYGERWSLAAFQAPAGAAEDPLAQVTRPHRAAPWNLSQSGARVEVLVGWIKSSDLKLR